MVAGITVSLVDAAIPTVFVRAEELAVDARRLAPDLDSEGALQELLEEIRCHGAVLFGLADNSEHAHTHSQGAPKIALVAPPASYLSSGGKCVDSEHIDLLGSGRFQCGTHTEHSPARYPCAQL